MNKAPAFQFYPSDWLSSPKITLMSPAEEGAYIRLLCYAWADPHCSIPDDDATLAVLSRLGEGWFNGGSTKLRACFSVSPSFPGRLVNERLLQERQKQEAWREKSRAGGKKSGKTRRLKREWSLNGGSTTVEANITAPVEPNGNSSSSSSSSLSLHPKKDSEKEETTMSRSSRDFMQEAREVLQFLNLKSGRQFREVDSTLRMIAARLKGQSEKTAVDIQACKTLIAKKVREWGADEKMAKYLRPETLFNRTKFESYLGEVSLCTVQTVTASSVGNLRPVPAGGGPKPCSPPSTTGSSSNVPSLVAL